MSKKVAFYTLGCKVNQYETNAMEQQFIQKGYKTVENSERADIYIINTCSVTNMAERKSRQMLRRVKEINKDAILVVCGCYAQVAKNELEKIPEIDIILGINEKNNIVEKVEEYMSKNEKTMETAVSDVSIQHEFLDFGDVTYTEKNRAVIKVQDGCNMFCTYCIIPYARGRIRSRKIESVVSEISKIASQGIKEVVITGIHIASYGKDFDEEGKKIRLIDLLERINQIEGIERIRLGSLEPTIIDEEFAKRLSKLEKICDHFHLSLQSGCNETLKRMNRKYTTERYKQSVDILRKVYQNVNFTTDVIVGFPGETEEEFNETYKFLEDINFYKIHVFKYSPRRGTVAEKMQNQIDGNIKEIRSNKLIELSDKNQNNYNEKNIGKQVKVLFEEYENGYFKGHTTNYMEVKVKRDEEENLVDKIVPIEIVDNDRETKELIGK